MRTFATMLKHRAGLLHSLRRQHLRRLRDSSELTLPNGEHLEQSRHRRKIQGRRNAHRISRQLQIQSARSAIVRAFNAQVPVFAQWDDHEVTNDWVPGESVTWHRYTEKSILALAARGGRAFHEFMPTRQALTEAGRVYRKIAYGPFSIFS